MYILLQESLPPEHLSSLKVEWKEAQDTWGRFCVRYSIYGGNGDAEVWSLMLTLQKELAGFVGTSLF